MCLQCLLRGNTLVIIIIVLGSNIKVSEGAGIKLNLESSWWKDAKSGVDSSGYMTESWRTEVFEKVVTQIIHSLHSVDNESKTNTSKILGVMLSLGFFAAMAIVKLVVEIMARRKREKVLLEVRRGQINPAIQQQQV